jgi:hypothetical protein
MPASSTPAEITEDTLLEAGVIRRKLDGVRVLARARSPPSWPEGHRRVEIGHRGGRKGRRLSDGHDCGRRSKALVRGRAVRLHDARFPKRRRVGNRPRRRSLEQRGGMASAAEQMAANTSWGPSARPPNCASASSSPRPSDHLPDRHLYPGARDRRGALARLHRSGGGGHRRHPERCSPAARSAGWDLRAGHHALHLGLDHRAALAAMVPALEQLKKEGEQGRKKINQYTRYGTVALATARPTGLPSAGRGNLVTDPGWFFRAPASSRWSAAPCS